MAELSIQRKKLSVLMPAKATAQIPKDSTFPLRKNCRDLAQLSILSIFLTKKPESTQEKICYFFTLTVFIC